MYHDCEEQDFEGQMDPWYDFDNTALTEFDL